MKVVILAGGLGTRMSELTKTIPKPMVQILYPINIGGYFFQIGSFWRVPVDLTDSSQVFHFVIDTFV